MLPPLYISLSNRYKIIEVLQTSFDFNKESITSSSIDLFDDKLRDNDIFFAKDVVLARKPGYAIAKEKQLFAKVSSQIMQKARKDAGISLQYLAMAFGKTDRTIRTWESSMEPPFVDVCLWFRIIGKSIWNYMREAFFEGENSEFTEEERELKQELYHYASNMEHSEIRKLCFLIFGNHGSNWHSILELMIEHVNTPLSQRVISARLVLLCYEMSLNTIQDENVDILPDLGYLKSCIEKETQVARSNASQLN